MTEEERVDAINSMIKLKTNGMGKEATEFAEIEKIYKEMGVEEGVSYRELEASV